MGWVTLMLPRLPSIKIVLFWKLILREGPSDNVANGQVPFDDLDLYDWNGLLDSAVRLQIHSADRHSFAMAKSRRRLHHLCGGLQIVRSRLAMDIGPLAALKGMVSRRRLSGGHVDRVLQDQGWREALYRRTFRANFGRLDHPRAVR